MNKRKKATCIILVFTFKPELSPDSSNAAAKDFEGVRDIKSWFYVTLALASLLYNSVFFTVEY